MSRVSGQSERLVVALVRGVHGLHGAVRVEVLTDRPESRFVPGAVLFREEDTNPLTIAAAEAVADGPGWRLRFREIVTREVADSLRDRYLEAAVGPDDELGRGTYYWHEVIGVTVRGVYGAELGTVRDVYRVAETEVFVVTGDTFGTFDLPAVRAFIRIFAPRRGEIVVDAEALDLRPPRARLPDSDRPRAPRRRSHHRTAATDGPGATGAEGAATAADVPTAGEPGEPPA